MAQITIRQGEAIEQIEVSPHTLVAEALRLHSHPMALPCGGKGSCLKCRIKVRGALSPLTKEELKGLSRKELHQGIRLACCTYIEGDAEVLLEEENTTSQICTDGISQNYPLQPMFSRYGIAIDIGTTTLAAQLYDREKLLATASAPNPQKSFGADVISRMEKSMAGDREALAETIRKALSMLSEALCQEAGCTPANVDGCVITGNTVMLHLLTGEDVTPLSRFPFAVKEYFGKMIPAERIGLSYHQGTMVYLPRCISAFVGGDITTALLASQMTEQSATALLADIGTNGELALLYQGKLTCCSTAAGPAFEGASLTCGMQGQNGAIDRVWTEGGALRYHTIGDKEAAGICGSGVADLLAVLCELGRMEETGFLPEGDVQLSEEVVFTQKDVRQVQMAKSAIRSGMETLLHTNEISCKDVDTVFVAGGFGSYLSMKSAAAIGLIPPQLAERCHSIGNAALSGAVMLLRNTKFIKKSEEIAQTAISIDLATDPYFIEQYMEQMSF